MIFSDLHYNIFVNNTLLFLSVFIAFMFKFYLYRNKIKKYYKNNVLFIIGLLLLTLKYLFFIDLNKTPFLSEKFIFLNKYDIAN